MEPQEQEPRVASLHALVRDIGALRRRLETDLTLTAAALEHGELAVADDLLGGALSEVQVFEELGLDRLDHPVTVWPANVCYLEPASRVRRRAAELLVAASVAALALLLQAAPATQNQTISATALPADITVSAAPDVPAASAASDVDFNDTFVKLSQLQMPDKPKPAQIKQVSTQLAAQVHTIREVSKPDSGSLATALAALRQERQILQDNNADKSLDVLVQNNASLITTLQSALDSLLAPLTSLPSADPADPLGLGKVLGGS